MIISENGGHYGSASKKMDGSTENECEQNTEHEPWHDLAICGPDCSFHTIRISKRRAVFLKLQTGKCLLNYTTE